MGSGAAVAAAAAAAAAAVALDGARAAYPPPAVAAVSETAEAGRTGCSRAENAASSPAPATDRTPGCS